MRVALYALALAGCALPVRLTAATAPMAAQVKAFSHVPLSSEPHPRDVTDEEGFPTVGTRIMVKGDLDGLIRILERIPR